MSAPERYRQVEIGGTPTQMGHALGEAAREEVRGFAAVALERVRKTVSVSRDRALAVAQESLEFARAYHPDACAELEGLASAADLPLLELMLLQVRNQLQNEDAGCTSLSVAPPAATQPIVAQNWDNDPELDPYTIVLIRRPAQRPDSMTLTQAGLVAYIGCNDAGMGVCLNTLPAPSRPVGVPHYFIVRAILECSSRADAVAAVNRAERAIPANLMLATPEGPVDMEVTVDDVRLLDGVGGVVTHTNHCVHPDLVAINERFPELIESRPRKRRIEELLAAAERPLTWQQVGEMLSDHQDHPASICRHPNDHPTTGFWRSVFSVVMEPNSRRLHATRGNPCSTPFQTYAM